jgi:DNA invertase Pin-like site-specific DNA recombinase
MTVYGYVRVSTDRQTVMQQIDRLREAGCEKIFRDKAVRATAKKRPALLALRAALKPGDTMVVSAIDRAFRSTYDAISFLDDVTKHGITFRSLAQHIDTRTPEGRKWYIDLANAAEYERAVISRRTREQMAAAKRRGKKFGRPRKLTKEKIALARAAMRNRKGRTMHQIALSLRISKRSLHRALRERAAHARSTDP